MNRKVSFFDKKTLLAIVGISSVLYLITASIFIIQNRLEHSHRVAAVKARQAKFDSLSPAEKAIRKAESYSVSTIRSTHASQRIFLDYVQRRYNLNPVLGIAQSPFPIPTNTADYPNEINYLARIIDPKNIVKTSPGDKFDGILYTNVYAANCDNIPLPTGFWDYMKQQYQLGGYSLTHDVLALRMIRDNNCPLPAGIDDFESQLTSGLVKIIKDPNTVADLRYEAIAFLPLSGRRDLVKPQWIDQIVSEQMPDGGWAAQADKNAISSDEHATLLALWALLQYSRPDVEYQPLIRH